MTLPARLPLLLFAAALGGAWWRALPPPAPAFVAPPPPVASTLPASFASTTLAEAGAPAQHPTLTLLPDGRIAAAWRQTNATREQDATIRFAIWDGRQWSAPRVIADRRLLANAGKAQVQTLGHPTLFAHRNQLHLWISGAHAWQGSSIHHLQSVDGGAHWSTPQRLATSPLFNLGSRNSLPPVAMADGGLGLPTSHALFSRHGEWLRFDARGKLVDKARLPHPEATEAPRVLALDDRTALALIGGAAAADAPMHAARTQDGGLRWQRSDIDPPAAAVSPTALIRLASGRLLLAAHTTADPAAIGLWLSDDQGQHWQQTRTLPASKPADPALVQGQDGHIHLALGRQPEGLRHVYFSEAWLLERTP